MSVPFILWGILTLAILLFLLYSIYKRVTYSPVPEEQERQRREQIFFYEDPIIRIKNSRYLYNWRVYHDKEKLNDRIINCLMSLMAIQTNLFVIHPDLSEIFQQYWDVFFAITVALIAVYITSLIRNKRHYAQIGKRRDAFMLESLQHHITELEEKRLSE